MIRTTSLPHDDVTDASVFCRAAPSAPAAFGTKISVLRGNFILGRASVALSRLGDSEVTELITSVLSNLVEGEILHISNTTSKPPTWTRSLNSLPTIAPAGSVAVPAKSTEDSQLSSVRFVEQPPLPASSPPQDPQVRRSSLPTHDYSLASPSKPSKPRLFPPSNAVPPSETISNPTPISETQPAVQIE